MKRIPTALCILSIMLSLTPFSVMADPSAENSVNEITALEQEILEFADQCREEENVSGSGTADFSKAYRIYADMDLFAGESLSREEYKEMEASAPVVWVVPVYYENDTCFVEVSKGLPLSQDLENTLTEEEKQEIRSREGKWTVAAASFEPGIIDYPAKIAALLEENGLDGETAEYTLAGGVPGIRTPLVLVFENGELSGIISPDCDLNAFEEEPARAGNGGGPLTLEQGKLYPFSDVRQVSLRNRPQGGTADDLSSGTGNSVSENPKTAVWAIVLPAAGGAVIALLAVRYKKTRRQPFP